MRKTFFTHLFIWSVVLGFASTVLAQSSSLTAESSNETGQIVRSGEGGLLWDNFQTKGASGVISNEHGGLPPGANQVLCADDFVVPGGETWTIDEIAATGFYSAGESEFWGVRFYADAGGMPGAVLATETVSVILGDPLPAGMLSAPVVLTKGAYWVSIYGIHTTAVDLATFRWNWYTSEDPEILSEPWLIDEAGFFGFLPWTSFSGLGLDALNSMQFQLFGQVGGGPLCVFMDDFESGLGNWTITLDDTSDCVWVNGDIGDNFYLLDSTAAAAGLLAADADICGSGTTTLTTSTMSAGVNATDWAIVWIEWDNDWRTIDSLDIAYVEMSINGGATWTTVVSWVGVDQRNTHEVWDVSGTAGAQSDVRFRFRTIQPGWDWWWVIDNFAIYFDGFIPVELTSFAASVNDGEVTLSWSTSTETNNQGFDVERNSGNGFEKIGFVAGFGTSTENHSYSYVDGSLQEGSYTYRLKQIDYAGTFEYSDVIEVDVTVPKVFALEQNYPNPFNPSTKIKFSLAADSKVSLTVFDILGQEVANLISGNLAAGSHEINFNASNIPSGVYFYRLDATGVDGTNFTSVKKMILTK